MVLTNLLSFAPVTDLGTAHSVILDFQHKGLGIYNVIHLDLELDKSYYAQTRGLTPGCLYLGHSQIGGNHLKSRHHRVPLICLDKPKFKPLSPWPGQLYLVNPAITAMFGVVHADRILGLRSFGVPEEWVEILAAVPGPGNALPTSELLEVVNVAQIHDFLEWVPLASAYLAHIEDDSDDDVDDDGNDDDDNDDGDDEWNADEGDDEEIF